MSQKDQTVVEILETKWKFFLKLRPPAIVPVLFLVYQSVVSLTHGSLQALTGSDGFLSPARLETYNTMRNDPCSPKAVSTLSAYLHFGHISGQRVALEASKHRKKFKVSCSQQLVLPAFRDIDLTCITAVSSQGTAFEA